jgi:hypothetical protein
MMPLRDVILYEGIDRALDLPARDWNTKFHETYDPIFAGIAESKQTTAAERLPDAPHTHPLETYAGTYAADGYPDFAVRIEGDGLQACTVGSLEWSELRHQHYNVFEWDIKDFFDVRMKVSFLVNDNGEIDSVSVPIESEVDNVIFKRKPLELPPDVIAALLGEYVTSIEGVAFTITTHDSKIYATQTGGTADEITAYKLDDSTVGLRSKRARFDFVREQGAITRLILKTPDITLEAPRKEA